MPGPNRRLLVQELLKGWMDGRIKLYLTMTALHYRRAHVALFQQGNYVPLETDGRHRAHVCAFARIHDGQSILTIVPRLVYGLLQDKQSILTIVPRLIGLLQDNRVAPLGPDVWKDTWVETEPQVVQYRNILTGEVLSPSTVERRLALPLAEIFRDCPVALLERIA